MIPIYSIYPLVMTNIAMENRWPIEIDGLPINSMVIFHGELLVITRGYHILPHLVVDDHEWNRALGQGQAFQRYLLLEPGDSIAAMTKKKTIYHGKPEKLLGSGFFIPPKCWIIAFDPCQTKLGVDPSPNQTSIYTEIDDQVGKKQN